MSSSTRRSLERWKPRTAGEEEKKIYKKKKYIKEEMIGSAGKEKLYKIEK